jgi:hypothetical protein
MLQQHQPQLLLVCLVLPLLLLVLPRPLHYP